MNKKLIFFAAIVFFINLISCTDHSPDDLTDPPEEIVLVNYTENVKVIIDNNCISCHSDPPKNGAPVPLLTYNQVKNAVLNANMIGRISAQPGQGGAMPLGGPRLPQNLIDIIVQWQEDGLLEK